MALRPLDASLEYQGDMLAPLDYKSVIRAILVVRLTCEQASRIDGGAYALCRILIAYSG